MNHAIDHGGEMPGNGNDEAPRRQFIRSQVNFTARANFHCRRPLPTQRFEQLARGPFIDACSRVALAALSRAGALALRQFVHSIVDLLVGKSCSDGDGPHHAIARSAFVPGRFSAAIIELKFTEAGLTSRALP